MATAEEYAIVGQALIVLKKSLDDIGYTFDKRARAEAENYQGDATKALVASYAWVSCLAYAASTILGDQIGHFTKGGEDANT